MTKILIADDNNENLYLLETVLKSHGHEVISARNGAEAIESALNGAPGLIITDILMPVMDGFELCRRWKAHEALNGIPLIFYTATYTDLKDEKFALSLGADRFVIKPQQPEVLLQIVQEVLAKPLKASKGSRKQSSGDEKEVLQQYNEVLFRKLEKKVSQLEDVIEKQKKAENELRESEQKYRTLITQSPDGVFIVNLQGTFLAVNRVMCENLKYSEEGLLSMSIWDIVPEQYIELHKKRIADIMVGKAPNTAAEYLVKGKDGIIHCVEILSAPYYEGKELIGFQGIARDITERKKAEDTLNKTQKLLEETQEISRLGGWEYDVITKRVVWTKEVYRLHGVGQDFDPNDISRNIRFYSPESAAVIEQAFARALEQGEPYDLELVLIRINGERIWVRTMGKPVTENDKVISISGIIVDITERKKFEQDLLESCEHIKKTLNDAINTMAKLVEMRDPYTAGHQHRVAELTTAIAGEMGWGDDQIEQLRRAAVIHDIGKMYVPSDILSKPGKLSDIEISLIRTHSQGGYDVVKGMDFPSVVAQCILQHHERLDGSGYPNSLKGGEICMEAKILSVSDVVEAMGSHRPYRPALGIDKALEEISKNKGKLYDPHVVDACLKLFKEKSFKFTE